MFPTGNEAPTDAALAAVAETRAELPAAGEALTSTALAACRTAEALGLMATGEADLRDLAAGRWTGKLLADIAPHDLAAWLSDPTYTGHGGESIAALVARVEGFLAARLAAGSLVAVTHGTVLRAALVTMLGAPASAFWRIDAPPLTALTASSDGRRWALRSLEPLPGLKASGG